MTMRKDQKGFTLVELIIAVAILAIVTLAVCGFIVVGSRSYTSSNTDIMLQQEAQLALNQISDVIIDTTDSINYGNGTELVLKDSEFSSEPDTKILVVVNKKGSNNDNDSYRFEWSKDTETIYFNTSDTVIDDANPEPVFDDTKRAILAQHVKELHIDISQFEENRVVMVSMTFQNGNKEYSTSNNVTVRNRIALNKIEIEPMKKANEFTITTVKDVVLEPGDSFNLAEKTQVDTNAETAADKAIVWELVDTGTTTSSITPDGQLTIGTNETRKTFLVRVSRVNEEYANQNAKVAKTVKVNVKRVNSVDLSCAATTIKAGASVTVNGSAVGYMLGRSCEAHSCLTDDETKDHDLTAWRIVRGPATIETSDTGKAEIKIASTAKKGDEIEIEATSDLSLRKSYGAVTGTIVLRVTEGNNGAKFIGSELKFGTDNDPGIFDYMRTSLRTDHGRYVFCVRIREAGTVGCANDYVMVYFTQGANERFSPDAFGLDHSKSYEIYFQVLDPRPKGSQTEASTDAIRTEYLGNLDDNGKYIGTMFDADEYFYAILNQPRVAVTINGVTYPNDEKENFEHYSFLSDPNGNPLPGMINIADGGAVNIWREAVLNNIRFTVYKEDENGRWKRVYGYAYDTEEYADNRSGLTRIGALPISPDNGGAFNDKGNNTGQNRFGKIEFNLGGDPTVKNGTNSSAQEMQEACGMYHIVPGFVYANNPDIRPGAYTGANVIYKNVPGDYSTYYYKQWDAVINLKIDMGVNLRLPDVNGEERWTCFPVPSDRKFPFDLRSEQEQTVYYNFTQYNKNSENRGKLGDGNVIVTCTYNATVDTYTITLKKVEVNGKQIKTHVYGVYTCNAKGNVWDRIKDEYDVAETTETNLTFTKNGEAYDTYFPTPLKGDFPFRSDVTGEQVRKRWQLIEFKQNDGSIAMEKCTVKCTYANDTYSIQLIVTEKTNTHKIYTYNYGTFTCGRNGTTWVYQSETGGVEEGTDIQSNVVVTFDNTKYNAFFPAPTDTSFPLIVRDSVQYRLPMYLPTDFDGYHCRTEEVTAVYDRNSGELEFCKREVNGRKVTITGYGKYTYNVATKQWEAVSGYQTGVRYEGKWDTTLAYFNNNNKQYMMEFPLPGESGFPSFSDESHEISEQSIVFYVADDVYGETAIWGWGHRKYKYDNASKKYKVEIQMWANGVEYNFTLECPENGTAWVQIP